MKPQRRATTGNEVDYLLVGPRVIARFVGLCLALVAFMQGQPALGADELTMLRALPIESSEVKRLDPSGVAVCAGDVLMVSDRSWQIFEIAEHQDHAVASTRHQLLVDVKGASRSSQWEGLACDYAGDELYLVGERGTEILRYARLTGEFEWLAPGLGSEAQQLGFHTKENAGAEGIAVNGDCLFIAMEREPRGLLALRKETGGWGMETALKILPLQPPCGEMCDLNLDLSDVLASGDHIYTLQRMEHLICRRRQDDFSADRCWSYALSEHAPQNEFDRQRQEFGLAEGIAVRGDEILLVLDNNGGARHQVGESDTRPLLLVLSLPADWSN